MFFVSYPTYILVANSVQLFLSENHLKEESIEECVDNFDKYGLETLNDCERKYEARIQRDEFIFLAV